MAMFIQQSQCVMKAVVPTELRVTPAVIAHPLQAACTPSPPSSCHRPTPRIVRPWEDAPSPRQSPISSPPTTPQSSSLTPGSSSLTPGSSSLTPGSSSLTPESSSLTPGSSRLTPGSSSLTPGSRSLTPGSSSLTPGSSSSLTPGSSTPNSSPVTPHQVSSSSQLVLQQHVVFLRAISRLQVKVTSTADTWLATLASCYLSEVLRLEGARSQALSCSTTTPNLHAQAVHRHYDGERLALLQQANSSLMGYSCTLAAAAAAASSRAATHHQGHRATSPTTPTTMPPRRMTQHNLNGSYSSGGSSGASSPEYTPTAPCTTTTRLERIAARLEGTTCSSSSTTPASKRLLSPLAVRHLEDWYHQHQEHPYADAAQARQLATDGGITTAQVRKWLANRRLRHHRSGSSSSTLNSTSRRLQQQGRARRTLVNLQ